MDEANDELTPAVGREYAEREAKRPGLLRQTQLYGVVNGLNAGIPLLLVPVLTRYLSPTDYALLLLFECPDPLERAHVDSWDLEG